MKLWFNKGKLWAFHWLSPNYDFFAVSDKKLGDTLSGWQQGAKLKIPDLKLPKNLDWKTLQSYVKAIADGLTKPGSAPPADQKPRVHMKFPYTFSAKIAQFPYKFYYKNNWIVRTYPWGFALALPLFWYIDRMGKCLILPLFLTI